LDVAQAPETPSLAVALVDTGIDIGHEDLAAVPVREAYVVRNCGPDPACDAGERCSPAAQAVPPARFHGTAVAGLIAATRGNGAGIAGIAPVARLISIDAFGADAAGGSRIAAGIECAIDKGARVINVSVQGKADTRAELEAALGRAEREGVLVILAAGNEIGDLDRNPEWPAALHTSSSLTVTAVDLEDRLTGQRFGLKSVDLAAPATERMVCSTFPGSGASENARDPDCSSTQSGRYGRFGQSSAAAAMVSGAALLLWDTRTTAIARRSRCVRCC
jgi:subtilisin family serine protease